jgi:hypothetical protein
LGFLLDFTQSQDVAWAITASSGLLFLSQQNLEPKLAFLAQYLRVTQEKTLPVSVALCPRTLCLCRAGSKEEAQELESHRCEFQSWPTSHKLCDLGESLYVSCLIGKWGHP